MSTSPLDASPLAGCRIVVPESRELDLFAGMLEKQGAVPLRCPLVAIHDAPDPAPVEAFLRRLVAGEHDDLVFFTGEGVNRMMDVARRAGIEADVLAALGRARRIVRGSKPARALRLLGLSVDIACEPATKEGMIARLASEDLAGRRVGVQLYPEAPPAFVDFLRGAGARVDTVLPYTYASDEEDERVAAMIGAMAAGEADMIVFTSTPQIRRLKEVAKARGLEEALESAMARLRIASVGPVTTEAVEKAGWRVFIAPEDNFHLKPFVVAIRKALAEA